MLCHTCDTDNDPHTTECQTCRTPVGAPVVHPDARVRRVRGVGRAAAVAVGGATLAYLLTVLVLPVQAALATEAGRSLDEDLLLTAALLELAVAVPYLLAVLAATVLVIVWTWRARKNLDAFPGAEATLSAGWAIAGWLVPFVNFVLPYRVVANIARESLWRSTTPWLVNLWWGTWLVFLFGERYVSRSVGRDQAALPDTLGTAADFRAYADQYTAAFGWYLVPAVACLVAGVSLIVLIVRVTVAQEARIARATPAGPILPGSVVPAPVQPPVVSPPTPGAAGGTIGA